MTVYKEIKEYKYYFWSSRDTGSVRSNVMLYDDNGFIGALWFYKDDKALPKAAESNGTYHLHYHESARDGIVDMLRNEKPLYLRFNDGGSNNSSITTTNEPVGEEE